MNKARKANSLKSNVRAHLVVKLYFKACAQSTMYDYI